eukprot:jgi/Phyca11/15851/fgenesh1_pg.PHYCAscaffold_16_\
MTCFVEGCQEDEGLKKDPCTTRDELKETEINARADAVLREWLDLEPEWLEVAQRQNPKIKIEDLSKEMSIDAQSGMHYALDEIMKMKLDARKSSESSATISNMHRFVETQ